MTNTLSKVKLYSPSAIGDILRIARERACQEERRTKRYMAESLGITVDRLTRMENNTAQIPFEIAMEWCQIVEDYTAMAQIKHIYGMELPPVDPRLLESVPNQLINLIRQATGAIDAAKKLLHISTQLRPGDEIQENLELEVLKHAEELLDVKQAAECTLASMQLNWSLCGDTLNRRWIQEAIADRVIIPSVSHFELIRKEEFFQRRFMEMGGLRGE